MDLTGKIVSSSIVVGMNFWKSIVIFGVFFFFIFRGNSVDFFQSIAVIDISDESNTK